MKKTFLSTLLISLTFLGCKETTTAPVITDIASIDIDGNSSYTFYPTDEIDLNLTATVFHTDGTSGDATQGVTWSSSDDTVIAMDKNNIINSYKNGGDAFITASSMNLQSPAVAVHVQKLVDFNITSPSSDINQTNTYPLEAYAQFDDGATGHLIRRNIAWDVNDSSVELNATADNYTTITFTTIGTFEVNATVFAYDTDFNMTKSIIFKIEDNSTSN